MNKHFLTKLKAIVISFFKVLLIAFPISFALVMLKTGKFQYGFDFFELNYKAAVVIAVAISLIFASYNAFEFSYFSKVSLDQYLKSTQEYELHFPQNPSIENIKLKLNDIIKTDKKLKWKNSAEDELLFSKKRSTQIVDLIKITTKNEKIIIKSRPKWKIWFMDFGVNYKNIEWVARILRSK